MDINDKYDEEFMGVTAVSLTLTMPELGYVLFSKKTCPHCGEKMKKIKRNKIVDGREYFKDRRDLSLHPEVRVYYYVYHCTCCNREFELSQLVKKDDKE
jgi:predicted nucleic acid-binding Zn ribbon protein